jgi:putative FmdB family regulatory protein
MVANELGQRVGGAHPSDDDVRTLQPLPKQTLNEAELDRLANLGNNLPRRHLGQDHDPVRAQQKHIKVTTAVLRLTAWHIAVFKKGPDDMPIYTYRCACGQDFDQLMPMSAAPPPCPNCGSMTRKIPAGFNLGIGAQAKPVRGKSGPGARVDPSSLWRAAFKGKPEKVRRELEFRRRLEANQIGSQTSERSEMGPERNVGAAQLGAPPASPTK